MLNAEQRKTSQKGKTVALSPYDEIAEWYDPCYNSPRSGETVSPEGVIRTVAEYFTEGHWRSDTRTGPPGKVGAYHRTLSTYVNALVDAGLVIERMSEPRATGIDAERRPAWAEVPAALVARCRKGSPGQRS